MARVNIGVDPIYLADQHLVAESVEIIMITGGLKKNTFEIKGFKPEHFKLGTGHINFFKDKLVYLPKRLEIVNEEMKRRDMKPGTVLNLDEFPDHLKNDYVPTQEASDIIRSRICERLIHPMNGKPGEQYYRYSKKLIGEKIKLFALNLKYSKLNDV